MGSHSQYVYQSLGILFGWRADDAKLKRRQRLRHRERERNRERWVKHNVANTNCFSNIMFVNVIQPIVLALLLMDML